MAWDPSVLRKYSSTSHFRLLNQVRSELKNHPLSRHQDGQIHVGMSRRAGPYRVPVDVPQSGGSTRGSRITSPSIEAAEATPAQTDASSFRDRLRAIAMR